MLSVKLHAIPPITMQTRRIVDKEEVRRVYVKDNRKVIPKNKSNYLRKMAIYQIEKIKEEFKEIMVFKEEGFDITQEINRLSQRLKEWDNLIGEYNVE